MNDSSVLKGEKLVPVIVINDIKDAVPLAEAIYKGGISVIEITFRTSCAASAIKAVRKALPQMTVGAGTVLSVLQAEEAAAAGAQFIVAPGFNPETADRCRELGLPFIPGVSSPTEIEAAAVKGLKLLKFFPAEQSGGAKYLKALVSPYKDITFMPTGGIDLGNIKEYLALPNVLACGGSFLFNKDDIANGSFEKITDRVKQAVGYIKGLQCKAPVSQYKKASVPFSGKTVTLGEIMLRLSPEGSSRLFMSDRLEAVFGGAEANTAILLSVLGAETVFVTRLPAGAVGDGAVNTLRRYGVDTHCISRGGSRMGLYYYEKGAGVRPAEVIYDRRGSAMAEATANDFDFEKIFDGASCLHVTGITPAISDTAAGVTRAVCEYASSHGIFVSFDVNYRSKLWSAEKASSVLSGILPCTDLCIINEEHAEVLFGVGSDKPENDAIEPEYYRSISRKMAEKFGIGRVAMTVRRTHSPVENTVGGSLYELENGHFAFSPLYRISIAERIGGGDAFSAGLLFSLGRGDDADTAVKFAVGCCCLKHSVPGDYGIFSAAEVNDFTSGMRNGVKR